MAFPDERKQLPWPVVMLAGYVLPGAGHFLHGEKKRGVLIGAAVLGTFGLGVLFGGVRVVEMPDFSGSGNLLGKLLTQPAFVAQFFAGPVALVAGNISKGLANDSATAGIVAHARLFDIAMLYTAIAGALNLLALIDVTARSARGVMPRDTEEARKELAEIKAEAARQVAGKSAEQDKPVEQASGSGSPSREQANEGGVK